MRRVFGLGTHLIGLVLHHECMVVVEGRAAVAASEDGHGERTDQTVDDLSHRTLEALRQQRAAAEDVCQPGATEESDTCAQGVQVEEGASAEAERRGKSAEGRRERDARRQEKKGATPKRKRRNKPAGESRE